MGSKGIFEKISFFICKIAIFLPNLCIFNDIAKNEVDRRAKFTKQKLSEIIQVTVPNFFYFDEILKIKELEPKNINF